MTENRLPEKGYVRLSTILLLIPISKSTWWQYVATGRAPQPMRLGPNIVAWRVEEIRRILDEGFPEFKTGRHGDGALGPVKPSPRKSLNAKSEGA